MKIWKKVIGAVLAAGIVGSAIAFTSFADVNETYDTTSTSGWSGNGNEVFNFRSEENGNQYLEVSYQDNNVIDYYEVYRDFSSMHGDVMLTFDIKFSDHITDNIFLRQRSTDVKAPAVRIFKDWTHVNYYSDGKMYRLIQSDISYSKWYSFIINMSVSNGGKQSILVKERDTGVVVGSIDNMPLAQPVDYVNQFVMGSDGTMCLDNLMIYVPGVQKIAVKGESYPTIGNSYTYTAKGLDKNGLEFSVPITWSLKEPVGGVSIDADSGVLTIDQTANVGRAVIVAADKENSNKKAYYLVDIEK